MKSLSTLYGMAEASFQRYSAKHRQTVARLMEGFLRKKGRNCPEWRLYQELANGYTLLDELILKRETAYKEHIQILETRLKDLEGRLRLDAENSHKAPSSSRQKKIKNSREKTGKRPGAQKGHQGVVMPMENVADQISRSEPAKCRSCGRDLSMVAASKVIKRQIVDIKNGVKFVHELQRVEKHCPDCGDFNRGEEPAEFKGIFSPRAFGANFKSIALYLMNHHFIPVARTKEVMSYLYDIKVSPGTLCNMVREVAVKLQDWEIQTKANLIGSPYLHVDETGLRCEKTSSWIHVHSTEDETMLSYHKNRGAEANEQIGILPEYKGHLISDGFKLYGSYKCSHSYCNAHILRELKYLFEEEKQKWAGKMARYLRKILHRLNRGEIKKSTQKKYILKTYFNILKLGFKESGYAKEFNGRTPDRFKVIYEDGKRICKPVFYQRKVSKSMNLLQRMRDNQHKVLAFVFKPGVPFTNNQAERDLRPVRLKEKISGCFRSGKGAESFFRVRSFISTAIKQKKNIINSLNEIQAASFQSQLAPPQPA